MKEEWKPYLINNEISRYEISNKGQIYDVITGRYTYGSKNKWGYMKFTFYDNNRKPVTKLVHRVVAELFIEKQDPSYDQIDHINCIKDDNRVSNLRWCTNRMNVDYAIQNGLMAKKKKFDSPRSKYNKNQVNEVIRLLQSGKYNAREISKITGVYIHLVYDIRSKRAFVEETEGIVFPIVGGSRKFSDEQIQDVISMLNGKFTIFEISKKTKVSKNIVRDIAKRKLYRELTNDVSDLSFKEVAPRSDLLVITETIKLLETGKYTCKEVQRISGLSKSVIEKLVYHQRWTNLTEGKILSFKNKK